jgi:hypothetical protein
MQASRNAKIEKLIADPYTYKQFQDQLKTVIADEDGGKRLELRKRDGEIVQIVSYPASP